MESFKVTFYESNGRLVRILEIGGMVFLEQFDWDGWYGFSLPVFFEIDEEKAVDLALRDIQVKHPDYINRAKARFKLYEFNLINLGYCIKARAA